MPQTKKISQPFTRHFKCFFFNGLVLFTLFNDIIVFLFFFLSLNVNRLCFQECHMKIIVYNLSLLLVYSVRKLAVYFLRYINAVAVAMQHYILFVKHSNHKSKRFTKNCWIITGNLPDKNHMFRRALNPNSTNQLYIVI